MDKKFYTGFALGFFFKDSILNVGKVLLLKSIGAYHSIKKKESKNKIDGITGIDFICNITDFELFNELFPEIRNCSKVQPYWSYFPNKSVIKISMDSIVVDYLNSLELFDLSVNEIFDFNNGFLTTLDLPFFQKFGKCYLYINYTTNKTSYTNVYSTESRILNSDFSIRETKLKEKYSNLICATASYGKKNEYVTKYFKTFLNNIESISVKEFIMNYDTITTLNCNLTLFNNNSINKLSLNETI